MEVGYKFFAGLAVLALAALMGAVAVAVAGDPPDWSAPVRPFQIAGGVYYVGTNGLAAYLIVSKEGAILLDGTTAENAALIEQNIQAVGVPLHSVKLLISDHAQHDHVGALAQIKRNTGARLLTSVGDTWALTHGQTRGDMSYTPRPFPPIKVDRTVGDGETIRLGEVSLTAHLTPGHTPGCTSWSTTVQEGGKQLNVLFLCSITVAGNVLVRNHSDILLTSHPDVAHVLEREARRPGGDPDAFVDPSALPSLVAESRAVFETSLAAARAPAR